MTQKQSTDMLLTSPSTRSISMSTSSNSISSHDSTASGAATSAFFNNPWVSSTIHLPNGEASPASNAAIGPGAWDRFNIVSTPAAASASEAPACSTANDLYEKMGLPHARFKSASSSSSAPSSSADAGPDMSDLAGVGSFFMSRKCEEDDFQGWACIQCGRSLQTAKLEHGVYVCEAEGCGTVQVCTQRVSDGREKNCREDEDKTIHGDKPWINKRPKHGMRNMVMETLGLNGNEPAGAYRNEQRRTERGSVQDALVTMYGVHGPAIAKRNTAAHTSIEKVLQEYGSLIDCSIRERAMRIIDTLSVNTAVHRMHCASGGQGNCQLDVMATPSKHLAMIVLELTLEQEMQLLGGVATESAQYSDQNAAQSHASTQLGRMQILTQLRSRVKSTMQANCHGQSEIKLRLALTVARMVLSADDAGARLRLPCAPEGRLLDTCAAPIMAKLDPETFDAPRDGRHIADTAGAKAAALVRRMKVHVATIEQRGDIEMPNALRMRLSKLVRSAAVDSSLRSIVHVPGVCDASLVSGAEDLAVVSEHLLVALLVDAVNQEGDASLAAVEPTAKRVGWSAQAVEEMRSVALKRATQAIGTAFAKAVEEGK